MSWTVITARLVLKNLCSGTQCGGFQFLLILDLWDISFHAVVVFALGKNLLFKFALGHCDGRHGNENLANYFWYFGSLDENVRMYEPGISNLYIISFYLSF